MFSSSHPYTAVTVQIESLTSEVYDEDDYAGIPELIEVIKIQGTGPGEAARAIRKKLKYANVARQLRALTILDGLLQNGGQRLQRNLLSDQPLLERLRIAAVDPMSDIDVREKCKVLFSEWMAASKEQEGLKGAVHLYNQLPIKKTGTAQRREQSRVLRENEEAAQRDMDEESEEEVRPRATHKVGESASRKGSVAQSSPAMKSSSGTTYGSDSVYKKDYKAKKFKIEKERPQIYQAIAQSSVAATDLANSLKRVNREHSKISDDKDVMKGFERCKNLRRQILQYIQLVETDEFIGGLIHANEELVTALMAFEVLDKSVEDDSDSEMEEAAHQSRQAARNEAAAQREAERMVARLQLKESQEDKGPKKPNRLAKPPVPTVRSPPPPTVTVSPPRKASPAPAPAKAKAKARQPEPESASEDSDDDNDPFGDKNMVNTPDPDKFKKGYSWKEV